MKIKDAIAILSSLPPEMELIIDNPEAALVARFDRNPRWFIVDTVGKFTYSTRDYSFLDDDGSIEGSVFNPNELKAFNEFLLKYFAATPYPEEREGETEES